MDSMKYYDKEGHRLTHTQWAALYTEDYKRVGWDEIPNPDGPPVRVSTVWLGIDHQYGDGPILIFETMVFNRPEGGKDEWHDEECYRYSTLEQAEAGHRNIVHEITEQMKLRKELSDGEGLGQEPAGGAGREAAAHPKGWKEDLH
jgi:hypothetical protein